MTSRRLQQVRSIAAMDLGDAGVVMMDHDRNASYELTETGAEVWLRLDQPKTIDELVSEIAADYGVDHDVCRADVSTFVSQLLDLDLLHYVADE